MNKLFPIFSLLLSFQMMVPPLAQGAENNPKAVKHIDNGGSGAFKSVAVSEETLPGFVVYRPQDLYWAATREKALPILIWGNGACVDTSIDYERMLIELASKGYMVVAVGDIQFEKKDRKDNHTSSDMLAQAIDWVKTQAADKKSIYYGNVDTTKIAAAGHSCGGAQVLANAANPDIKTCLILNAGMGDIEMAGASKESLTKLHTPMLYLTGGPEDVAYNNAQFDYERINHVPVVYADMSTAGHGGTYWQPGGGDFGRMVEAWLDWNLKDKEENKRIFIQGDLSSFPGWTIKSKGYPNDVKEVWIKNGDRKIFGIESAPKTKGKKGVAIISHGFNGTHHFGRDYFDTLNGLGYTVYTFDFPCGGIHSSSDNNTMKMSVIDEKNDLKSIVRHYLQQPDTDKDRIVLIGESQGGFVSAIAASELKDTVSNLVLVYPALCIPDDWNNRYKTEAEIPDTTNMWNVLLGRNFFMELRDFDVYSTICRYEGPVQIIHGSKDPIVPLSYSEKAMKLYKNAHIGVIPGAGHGFNPEQRAVSNRFVKEFLEATAVPRQ